MLHVLNRDRLIEDSLLIPIIEQLAACLADGDLPVRISSIQPDALAQNNWMVLSDRFGCGVAFNSGDLADEPSPIQARLNYLRRADKITRAINRCVQLGVHLQERMSCPDGWRIFRVSFEVDNLQSFFCAASIPAPGSTFFNKSIQRTIPIIRVKWWGDLQLKGAIQPGRKYTQKYLRLRSAEPELNAFFYLTEGDKMTIRIVEAFNSQNSSMDSVDLTDDCIEDLNACGTTARLDIGEIRISLRELLALRVGSEIILDAHVPLQCSMRIGATSLAEGTIEVAAEGFKLEITKILT